MSLWREDLLCQFGDPSTLAFKDHLQAMTRALLEPWAQGAIKTIRRHHLDGLVMVGNLANQVDTAFLAEACAAEKLPTKVLGIPVGGRDTPRAPQGLRRSPSTATSPSCSRAWASTPSRARSPPSWAPSATW